MRRNEKEGIKGRIGRRGFKWREESEWKRNEERVAEKNRKGNVRGDERNKTHLAIGVGMFTRKEMEWER